MMSSWLQDKQRRRFRVGYHQEKPLGTFIKKDKPATVVTAYYDMKSKYDTSSYRQWIRLFLETCSCHLIFFTDEEFGKFVWKHREQYKDRTKVIIVPKSEWSSSKNFSQAFWERQYEKDPEKNIHSIDLYKIWYEKKEFVKMAIRINPWGHTDFVWTDAGICRNPSMTGLIRDFPVADRIPTDRILMLNPGEFTENDNTVFNFKGIEIMGGGHGKMRMSAGIIAGSIQSWKTYDSVYEKTLDKFIDAGIFCGKEQNVMATIVLENRDLVSLVEPKPIFGDFWRYLLLWLGSPPLLYEIMNDERRNKKPMSFEDMYMYVLPNTQNGRSTEEKIDTTATNLQSSLT